MQEDIKIFNSLNPPISISAVMRNFREYISDYEIGEILEYRDIYTIGMKANKINESKRRTENYGYDDENFNYKIVLNDHLAYRYQVVKFLGKGSFG